MTGTRPRPSVRIAASPLTQPTSTTTAGVRELAAAYLVTSGRGRVPPARTSMEALTATILGMPVLSARPCSRRPALEQRPCAARGEPACRVAVLPAPVAAEYEPAHAQGGEHQPAGALGLLRAAVLREEAQVATDVL